MSTNRAVWRQRDDADVVDHHVSRASLVRDDGVGRQQRPETPRSGLRTRHQIEKERGVLRRQNIAQLQPAEKPGDVVWSRGVARIACRVARTRLAQRFLGHFRNQPVLQIERPLRLRRRVCHAGHLEVSPQGARAFRSRLPRLGRARCRKLRQRIVSRS